MKTKTQTSDASARTIEQMPSWGLADIKAVRDHANYLLTIALGKNPTRSERFKIGERVTISDPMIRPRYVDGVDAQIVKMNRTTATIRLGEIPGGHSGQRFQSGATIRCPLASLVRAPAYSPS